MRRASSIGAIAIALLLISCSEGSVPTVAPERAAAPPPQGAPGQVAPQAVPERKLTYTGDVVLRGRDPWALADQARKIPGDLGGDLLSLQQTGEGDGRSARLTMRVPAARFDEALDRLKRLGADVVSSRVETKDVTDQFVDLDARLTSKKREVQQYESLLSQAKTVDDTLKVTQALARAQTELEQLQGQMNALSGRIDYSTITVTIDNVADLTTQSAWAPARTATLALVALVDILKFLGDAVIWIVIVGWVPALLIAAFVYLRRWSRRRFPPKPRAPSASGAPWMPPPPPGPAT